MAVLGRFIAMFEVPFISSNLHITRTGMSLLNVLQPHPEDRLRLRLHRARSVVLTAQEFVASPPAARSIVLQSKERMLTSAFLWQARRNPCSATNVRRRLHSHRPWSILLRARSSQDLHSRVLFHRCSIRYIWCRHSIGFYV